MSQIILVNNSLTQEAWVPKTKLTKDESSGTSVFNWENPSGFTASWALQFGETGQENTEIKLLSSDSPTGTLGTLTTNLDFDHPKDTVVYGIKYDKLVFGVATGGTNAAGTVATIGSGTIDIGADAQNTFLDYSSGTSTDAYKTKFRNSVTTDESGLSDWILPGGLPFYSLGRIRERVKEKLFSSSYIKSDETINDWINEWRESMNNEAVDVNEDYSIGTVDIAFSGTAELGTITNTDFKSIRRVWMTSNGDSYNVATKMEQVDFDPDQTFTDVYPRFYMVTDNVIGRKPNDSAGTARIAYYSTGTVLTNDSDELPYSMRGYTKSFVHYSLAQAYLKDGKDSQFQNEIQLATFDLEKFRKQLTPRNSSSISQVKLMEPINGDGFDSY